MVDKGTVAAHRPKRQTPSDITGSAGSFPSARVRWFSVRWILTPVVCLLGVITRGAESAALRSPTILLQSAVDSTPSNPATAARIEAGIRSALLVVHGRVLPDDLPQEKLERLAAGLRNLEKAEGTAFEAELEALPKADDLSFDGQRYLGGNLACIDSVLGQSKRPVAFDRAVPTLLVPIAPEAEAALLERRASFQGDFDHRELRSAATQAFGGNAATLMFADGQFLRPYIGRFDDLYFHLFQNGNGASAMAFCGLADGLGQRTYQPVLGITPTTSNATAPFDLGDILTDGGKTAVRRYLGPGRTSEPFKAFAFRVFPTVVAKAHTLKTGARFTVSQAEMVRALRARQHFYPTQVPPLYRSPDRFLGWNDYSFFPVANKGPALPPGAAESWYPLPQRNSRAAADTASEGAASAQLFESSSAVDIVWEDPQLSSLLSDPDERPASPRTPPAQAPIAKAPVPAPATENPAPNAGTDPRLRGAPTRLIAIVTPRAVEAREYLAGIVASDERIRAIERERGRVRLLREFIGNQDIAPAADRDLQEAIRADMALLEERDGALETGLQQALQQRAGLRAELTTRLLRDRVRPLEELGKKPSESPVGPGSSALSL